MSEEKTPHGISRREFLKDAGLVVGGATVGSLALANACGGTTTTTVTAAGGGTKTVTTTVGGGTVTTTVSGTGAATYVDPVDGTTYSSLAALQAHFNAVHPDANASIVNFKVNGKDYSFFVKPYWSLVHVIREGLQMYGTKSCCQYGECGGCTVIVNGQAMFACMLLACEMQGASVTTLEGLSNNGVLDKVQQRFYDQEAVQCGICTPGFIMAAEALLATNAKPTMADLQLAFSGHICMCGNLHRVLNALVGGVS